MNSGIDFDRGFTGQVYDKETGLMLYRNRYYSTDLGRFVSRDPIGYEGDGVNLLRYVGNSPIMFSDPEGLQRIIDMSCILGGTPQECANYPPYVNRPPLMGPAPKCFDLKQCLAEAQKDKEISLKLGAGLCTIFGIEGIGRKAASEALQQLARKMGKEWLERYLSWAGEGGLGAMCFFAVSQAAELDYQIAVKRCYEQDNAQ